MKKTEWFPTSVHPAYEGWYEARYDGEGSIVRRYFSDAAWWAGPGKFNRQLFGSFEFESADQWRGLAEQPK